MRISRMNKYNKGKLRAFFDLELDMGITIKGFKLMEGINGLFASMPSQEKDGEWYDTIFCSKDVRGEINRIALESYAQEESPMETSTQSDDIPF